MYPLIFTNILYIIESALKTFERHSDPERSEGEESGIHAVFRFFTTLRFVRNETF